MSNDVLRADHRDLARESVRILFLRHRLSRVGVLAMIALLSLVYRNAEPGGLLVWLAAAMVGTAAYFWCIRAYFMAPDRYEGYGWARVLALCSGLLGLALGVSPCFFLDQDDPTNVVLATLFLVSPMFGSTVFAAAYFPVHVTWTLGTTLPLTVSLLTSDVTDLVVLGGGLAGAGIPAGLVLGWILSREFDGALRDRLEKNLLIDELRREKQRVESVSMDKSRFLAAVSHDLRQPLHALDLFHASLRARLRDGELGRLLDLAGHASRSLGEMLGELMDISRFDAGRIVANKRVVAVAPLLRECVDEMTPLAEEKGLVLRLRARREVSVHSDPVLLKRVIRNLVSNAIRHTETGGVLVGVRVCRGEVRIEVRDTGPGIDDEQLPYIFDEFYQIDNPERDREKGLGLGLAIVRRVTEMLGHTVHVRSRPGTGTCFSVTAPLCGSASSPAAGGRNGGADDVDVSGVFVLVVDDDRVILQGMRALLLGWGCEVLLAESGVELIDELAAHDYPMADALICDYRLRDGRTGIEVVESVRSYLGVELPALIVSGDVHPEVRREVIQAGCRWIEKPVREGRLRRILAEMASGRDEVAEGGAEREGRSGAGEAQDLPRA